MPWFGVHDDKSAVMAVVPYDGSVGVEWIANYNDYQEVAQQKHERTTLPRILALTPAWQFPETKPGTEISCFLLPGADHVGMAKRYRRIAIDNGTHVALRDKAKANPDVEKLRGAIYTGIYGGYPHYVNMPGMAFTFEELDKIVQNMHEHQNVPRALIHAWGTFENYAPVPWPISEELGGAVTLKRVVRRAKSYGWLFSAYHSFVSLLDHDPRFNADLAPRNSQGRPSLGSRWKAVDESRWADLAKQVLPKEIEAIGQNADITDIAFTGRVGDGGRRLAEYLASTGLVLGTERGNEWLVPKYHMFEGMVAPYRDRPLVRYSHPAPLFNLVYHDAIVNFGKIQDPTQLALNLSGDYYVKTLRAMLYGDGPMVFFAPYEYEGVKPYLRFAAEFLCPLHESIGFEEMTGHAYLSEDALVQRTRFANGAEILVNLGPTPWASSLDGELPGYGFRAKRADGSTLAGRFRHSAKIDTRDWDF
ncbi:MAG TPA: glycoside hydrolase [Verrucomicrobiae bacterium]|nr:glycoside hydrolase [Verrucomicrobiae bacterium]